MLKNPKYIGAEGTGIDFGIIIMDNMKLRYSRLIGSNFTGETLRDVDFSDSNLSESTIEPMIATGTIFRRTNLTGCHMKNTNFTNAIFNKAIINGVNFTGATMPEEANTKEKLRALVKSYDGFTIWVDGTPLELNQ